MATFHVNSKGVQTDPNMRHDRSKLLKTLQTYITAVSRYRLQLFNQYTQSNEFSENQDLFKVRKEILHRFQLVINELEQTLESFQAYRLSTTDVHQIIDRPVVQEVIETSLNAELPLANRRKQSAPNTDEWRMYRRDLQETKEDLHFLNHLVHRGISKIDRLVNIASLYV